MSTSMCVRQASDSEGHTCLDWAAFNGHLPVVQYLVQRRAMDPTRTDPKVRPAPPASTRMASEDVMCDVNDAGA
jgi:ankyrin repeat protein